MSVKELRSEGLFEFLTSDGHRIPTELRKNPGDLKKGTERMVIHLKKRTNKDIEDVVRVTYDGHPCPCVKSPKRIFALARDSKGAPMNALEVLELIAKLNAIEWYSIKKVSEVKRPAAATAASSVPISEGTEEKKRRFGRMVFDSFHSKEVDLKDIDDEYDAITARSAVKLGTISRELGLSCIFEEDGSPVSNPLHLLTKDEVAIHSADPVKFRKLAQYSGRILNYEDEE